MEAKELRLGNFVKLTHGEKPFNVVLSINEEYISVDEITFDYTERIEVEPIEITKEWLLKFGFEKRNSLYVFKYFSTFYLEDFRLQIGASRVLLKIKYVHELQNLYFALTKKEL